MNKLYVIRFKISHDFTISTWSGWDQADAEDKMRKNPEWTYTLVENNDIHKIWEAM